MFESVNAHTHGRTPARLVYYKLTSEPSAQVSELKIWFEFCMYTTLGQGQEMTLTFNTQISSLNPSV